MVLVAKPASAGIQMCSDLMVLSVAPGGTGLQPQSRWWVHPDRMVLGAEPASAGIQLCLELMVLSVGPGGADPYQAFLPFH